MKEISYEGPLFDKEREEWEKKKKPNERPKGNDDIRPLRTYRTDVEELVQKEKTTPIQVVMAEAARREERGESRVASENKGGHLGWVIFSLLLILAFGVGVGLYVLVGAKVDIPLLDTATTTPATDPETRDALSITISGAQKEQIIADIAIAFEKTTLPKGEARMIRFIVKEEEEERDATTKEFFDSLFPMFDSITLTLVPTLDTSIEYRAFSNGTSLSGIIRIPARSQPAAYATMLEWESTMGVDLVPVMNAWYDRSYLSGLQGRAFTDRRIAGEDVRVLYDVTERPVLAYGFANKKTLVIAGNTDALAFALEELAK